MRGRAAWIAVVPAILTIGVVLSDMYGDPYPPANDPPPGFWDIVSIGAGGIFAWVLFFFLIAGFLWLVEAAEAVPVPGPARRVPIPQDIRWMVFARDDYRCLECGSPVDLTIDHIQPVSWGGSNDPSNLQTLCRSCNSVKGDRW